MTSPRSRRPRRPSRRRGRGAASGCRSRRCRACWWSSASSAPPSAASLTATDPSIKSADDLPDGVGSAFTLLQDVVFVFAAWIAIKLALGRAPPERFGLRRVRNLRPGARLGGRRLCRCSGSSIVLDAIFGSPHDQALVTDIKEENSIAVLVGCGVLTCVVAPVVEELFFRGFMFRVFAAGSARSWAALLVGVVFGLGHAPRRADPADRARRVRGRVVPPLLATQSIIPCMALHALNNSITFGLTKISTAACSPPSSCSASAPSSPAPPRVSARSRGGRMRRPALALARALALPATAAAQTPPPAPTPHPPPPRRRPAPRPLPRSPPSAASPSGGSTPAARSRAARSPRAS